MGRRPHASVHLAAGLPSNVQLIAVRIDIADPE
jgi:hypothetical protein